MAPLQNVHRSGRLSLRRKVKTGCQTCKRRKVKCDETWPVCHRCQSTGRVCDGYGVWGGGSRTCNLQHDCTVREPVDTTLSSPSDDVQSTPTNFLQLVPLPAKEKLQAIAIESLPLIALPSKEKDSYEWFVRRSATKLPGLFQSPDSMVMLLQATLTEPAVRHAMFVLSSAHKEEIRRIGFTGEESNNEQTLFTMSQYSKAITHLQRNTLDHSNTSILVTMFVCMLFIGADFLRGHYTSGLLHLQSGLNLLLEDLTTVKDREEVSNYTYGWVITTITRQFVQAKLLGQLPRYPCRKVLNLGTQMHHDTFRSIHHARRSLEHIMLRAFDIQEQLTQMPSDSTRYNTNLITYHEKLKLDTQKWFEACEATVKNIGCNKDRCPKTAIWERMAYDLLKLYYQVATILVGTCLNPLDESRFDQHDEAFLYILLHSIETHKLVFPNGKRNPKGNHDPEPDSPNSIADMGWIAPLYFTAVNCRNPRIRHHAIELLRASWHKEGIWNAALAVAVASKIVGTEERDFYKSRGIQQKFSLLEAPSADDLNVPTLPAKNRLSVASIVLPDDRAGKLVLHCTRQLPGGTVEWNSGEYSLRTHRWVDSVWMLPKKT